MALDMFIMNNDFKRVAYFETKMLEPCVGLLPSRIAKDVIGLPAEFYLKGDVLILQLRSKNKKGRKEDLVKEISSLADKYLFSEIILVSSLSNSNRPDNEIRSQ
jgi:predicted ATP-grasp superfamily ATP-dependent carboligase